MSLIAKVAASLAEQSRERPQSKISTPWPTPAEPEPVPSRRRPATLRLSPLGPLLLPVYHALSPRVHPAVADVQQQSIYWTRSLGLISPAAERAVARQKLASLPCRCFPTAGQAQVQFAVDYIVLQCLLDDRVENNNDIALIDLYLDEILSAFATGTGHSLDPTVRAAIELRERFLSFATPLQLRRFVNAVGLLFDSFKLEARYRMGDVALGFEGFIGMRQVNVGVGPLLAMIDPLLGISLPPAIQAHNIARALDDMTSRIGAWANDLFTFEHEATWGQTTNTVLYLAHHLNLDPLAASELVTELHDREVQELIQLAHNPGSLDPEIDQVLRRYGDVLLCFVRGHYDWGRETERYAPSANANRPRRI